MLQHSYPGLSTREAEAALERYGINDVSEQRTGFCAKVPRATLLANIDHVARCGDAFETQRTVFRLLLHTRAFTR